LPAFGDELDLAGTEFQCADGSDENLNGGLFLGDVDELRVRLDARSPDWIAAQYLSLTGALPTFAPIVME